MILRQRFSSLTFSFFALLLIATLSSCSVTVISKPNGFASFTFSDQSNSQGRSESIEDAAFVVVTLVNEEGVAVLESEQIALYDFGGSKISQSLSLAVGNYTLTEYNILDQAMNIIFSTPIDGSELAYLVDIALPIDVEINANTTSKVNPQVLSTAGFTPEAFGYTSFGFNVAETIEFLASALIYNDDPLVLNWELTDASIAISNAGNVLYSGTLEALTNQIMLPSAYASYDLTISKVGYTTKVVTYTKAELEAFFISPLTLFLQ